MFMVTDILLSAGISFSVCTGWAAGNVYITSANQLIGTYKDLDAFRKLDTNYAGWQAHHIVENDDLQRLGVSTHAPAYETSFVSCRRASVTGIEAAVICLARIIRSLPDVARAACPRSREEPARCQRPVRMSIRAVCYRADAGARGAVLLCEGR